MSGYEVSLFEDGLHFPFARMNDECTINTDVDTPRVKIICNGTYINVDVIRDKNVPHGHINLNVWTSKLFPVKEGDTVEIGRPDEINFRPLLVKISGKSKFTPSVSDELISDIVHNNMTFEDIRDFFQTMKEVAFTLDDAITLANTLTKNMSTISFDDRETYGFHSLGGVPGNKITPIIVSIVASAGLTIPKMSTRAITSACGTSDSVELYCNNVMRLEMLKDICERTNGIMSCNESLAVGSIDPVTTLLMYANVFNTDPPVFFLASIIAYTKSTGNKNCLIDIPLYKGSKISTQEMAESISNGFVEIGRHAGVNVECITTYSDGPIGFAVGPTLEAIECMRILEGKETKSTAASKACRCAGRILEMAGRKNGEEMAKAILESGRAHEKFIEIVVAQGGNKDISSDDLSPGIFSIDVKSEKSGKITSYDNNIITDVAKIAGAPFDKGAGLIVHKMVGEDISVGEVLFTLYSSKEESLKNAYRHITANPYIVEFIVA